MKCIEEKTICTHYVKRESLPQLMGKHCLKTFLGFSLETYPLINKCLFIYMPFNRCKMHQGLWWWVITHTTCWRYRASPSFWQHSQNICYLSAALASLSLTANSSLTIAACHMWEPLGLQPGLFPQLTVKKQPINLTPRYSEGIHEEWSKFW